MACKARGGLYLYASTHTLRHEVSKVEHNYGCVYMQTAPQLVAKSLRLEEQGIALLSPVFDLDFGKEAMASAMLGLGRVLGKPKPLCLTALMAGGAAVQRHGAAVEKQGRALLESLQPEDKVLVLITRNYGLSEPFQVLIPATQGAEMDGQYPWAIEVVLRRHGLDRVTLASPILEKLIDNAVQSELLLRAVITGDVLLCAPSSSRAQLAPAEIPE